jgi:hypothetical protein
MGCTPFRMVLGSEFVERDIVDWIVEGVNHLYFLMGDWVVYVVWHVGNRKTLSVSTHERELGTFGVL